jgi:hypothetical protein
MYQTNMATIELLDKFNRLPISIIEHLNESYDPFAFVYPSDPLPQESEIMTRSFQMLKNIDQILKNNESIKGAYLHCMVQMYEKYKSLNKYQSESNSNNDPANLEQDDIEIEI